MHAIFSEQALRDLAQIWTFVAEESEASADQLVRELILRGESLESMPFRYALLPGIRGGYRRTTVRTWAIY